MSIQSDLFEEVHELRDKVDRLRTALDLATYWAREISDQYLDGDPDVRKDYVSDMKLCREVMADTDPISAKEALDVYHDAVKVERP